MHVDHLGSTSLTTRGSAETASRADYAYGAARSATGDLKTDHTFTGEKPDVSGLLYDNACYEDPALGAFISPSTMSTGALANGSTARAERTHPARALSLPKPLQALLQGFSGFTTRLAARGGPSAALSVAGGQSMNAATLRRQPLRGPPRRLLAPIDLHHPRRFPAAMRRAMPTRP